MGGAHRGSKRGAVAIEGGVETNQLQFLEELASLLQPQTSLEAEAKDGRETSTSLGSRTRPIPVASRDVDSSELATEQQTADAREYLNNAELLLVSQRNKNPRSRNIIVKKKASSPDRESGEREKLLTSKKKKAERKQSSYRQSLARGEAGRSQSCCWLKESKEKEVREWLKRKERESASKRLVESRERQQERKKHGERARERQEREAQAKEAYQQWQNRKASEERLKREAREARDKQVQSITQEREHSKTTATSQPTHRKTREGAPAIYQ